MQQWVLLGTLVCASKSIGGAVTGSQNSFWRVCGFF